MKLYEKIIKIRKDNNLSQEEFGNKINVSRQAVSKWENEETKPDVDKIIEIGKTFNISFDYLLNDDIEDEKNATSLNDKVPKKEKKSHPILKFFLIILAIYLFTVLYKGISQYRFYLIGKSFSEENYSMTINTTFLTNNVNISYVYMYNQRYNNKDLTKITFYENRDDIDYSRPGQIEFIDYNNKINYNMWLHPDLDKYIYSEVTSIFNEDIQNSYTDEELEELINPNLNNQIRNTTIITPEYKIREIIFNSLNPFCIVSNLYRAIISNNPLLGVYQRTEYNNDYLVSSISYTTKFDGSSNTTYSYDYVPDHQKDFNDPLENFKDEIATEEDLELITANN